MCFTLDWLKQILILCVIVGATIGILQIIVPYAISKIGITMGEGANVVVSVIKIVFWAFVAIIVIIVVFMLLACLWQFAGGANLLPHR